MKPIKAWAICTTDDDGDMLTCPDGVPELFATRKSARDDIRDWMKNSDVGQWKPRPVRVTIYVEE